MLPLLSLGWFPEVADIGAFVALVYLVDLVDLVNFAGLFEFLDRSPELIPPRICSET